MKCYKYYVLLSFLVLSNLLVAQELFDFQISFTHENDFLGISNQDDNYTGGAQLELLLPEFNFPQPFFELENGTNYQILALGGTAYTPQDLLATEVVLNDRPYASLTYMIFGKLSIGEESKSLLNSQLIFGLTGWQGPGEAQYYIHDRGWFGTTRPNPRGWDNQIGFNGSFVVNYNILRMQSFNLNYKDDLKTELFRPSWLIGGDFGNYMMNLEAGLYLNMLNINSFPVFGANTGGTPILLRATETSGTPKKGTKGFRLHLFAEPKVRLVGYDTTLQGLLFNDNSPYTIDSGNINRIVLDFKAGVKLLLANRFFIGYNHFLRTQEFKQGKNVHHWGGVTLGYTPLKSMK
ncbi:lipid A-modifier LpxR family protein [Flagellimonas meishanensis]|uniref:lipid A-modifier LpxR family protein n=1 Tax=Flagellimonas meishanensis TaxID=2873264 RepID=UPI001CA6A0AE|nr:lipid A-modifier LpxR family protein [[Muricauda] meishanensis]